MNKKSYFTEFGIKVSSSSLPTFYDNFWLIWHYSIHSNLHYIWYNSLINGTFFFYQMAFQLTTSIKFKMVYKKSCSLHWEEESCPKPFSEIVVRLGLMKVLRIVQFGQESCPAGEYLHSERLWMLEKVSAALKTTPITIPQTPHISKNPQKRKIVTNVIIVN